ncbi:rRNA-processing protein bfr2 [Purpureocillium takamizusanense]|uniref:Protein BFR2 n=1 Tax=Purpureocillium takamizusanense TaxID=2060973 RepID=A0A9Q8QME3_9HYPO|nr:rRNA-processing protein bfr2 [Purpureocillium takamizusanense]UNI22723.1 rRNA-processing protein bfr2 [Purpureocillium takamizusanense]
MAKLKGRAKDFEDPDEKVTKDYDPEANEPDSDNSSDSGASDDQHAGTEHYVPVGKSKLREREGVSLGPQYSGSRVSRSALDAASEQDDSEGESSDGDESYDDPETANLSTDELQASDSEIDSENALAESDAERFGNFVFRGSSKPASLKSKHGKRPTAVDFMSSDDDEERGGAAVEEDTSGSEVSESDDDDMDDGLDALVDGGASSDSEDDGSAERDGDLQDSDASDDEGEAEDDEVESDSREGPSNGTSNTKPHMAAFSKQADVEKGLAIQQQRKSYDCLLNLRIRLQKALIAANTLPTLAEDLDGASEPYEAAEEAAVKLLNTISTLRENFGVRTGDKRKRELDITMDSETIWKQLQDEEATAVQFREDRLEKWSRKVQSVNVTPSALGQRNKSLVSALQDQLANPESRLLKRTRVPRSCAPAQAAKKIVEDEAVYDDADFYQLLLKELVDQRTVETSSAQTSMVPTVMLTAAKEAKVRKQVDRKASKGRKMRFTVHEKLQNFMAPEDRTSWEGDAIDRFFGTLFGRKMELNENESEDEEMDDLDAEEEGLRLFRN